MTGFEFRSGPTAGTLEVLANGHRMGTVSFDDGLQAWRAEADRESSWFPSFGRAINYLYSVCEPELPPLASAGTRAGLSLLGAE
jgi:hypothetical protein